MKRTTTYREDLRTIALFGEKCDELYVSIGNQCNVPEKLKNYFEFTVKLALGNELFRLGEMLQENALLIRPKIKLPQKSFDDVTQDFFELDGIIKTNASCYEAGLKELFADEKAEKPKGVIETLTNGLCRSYSLHRKVFQGGASLIKLSFPSLILNTEVEISEQKRNLPKKVDFCLN